MRATSSTEKQSAPTWSRRKGTANLWSRIELSALEIADRQATRARLATALDQATNRRNDLSSALNIARQNDATAMPALQQRFDAEQKSVDTLKRQINETDLQLLDQHSELGALHRDRRQLEALGGRVVDPVTVQSWQDDPGRRSLLEKESQLTKAVTDCQATTTALAHREEEADAKVRELRAAVHLGKATAKDLQVAQAAARAAADAHLEKAGELDGLREALTVVRSERESLDGALRHRVVPRLQAAHRAAMRDFVEALRSAVLASETVWAYHTALSHEGVTPQLSPWHELRVMVDDSKFRYFIHEAIERGYIDDEA